MGGRWTEKDSGFMIRNFFKFVEKITALSAVCNSTKPAELVSHIDDLISSSNGSVSCKADEETKSR